MPDGSKQEFGPDGKLLRVIDPGTAIKKTKSDIIRYVPSTPDRVATVQRIFDLCLQGYGGHYIAQALNAEGLKSPIGQHWNQSRVTKLLRNPVYRGAIAWNRRTMGSLFGLDGRGTLRPKSMKGWKQNDESDWIVSEGVHEALITPERFAQAQRMIAKRRADAGKARPTKRTLLANLLVCKRCGNTFTTIRDRRWPGPTGEGYRYYTCSGYHRYGKVVCRLTNLPGPALDKFVLETVQRVLLGDETSTKNSIDAFVKAVLKPKSPQKKSRSDERDFDLLNRKIKATVAMLADPDFEGLDDLRTTLADLKARRDALAARLKGDNQPATPQFTEKDLRAWATERLAKLNELHTKSSIEPEDRELIHAFVDRIEINPETKTGVIYLPADLENAWLRGSTRQPIGDFMANHESCFCGLRDGIEHVYHGRFLDCCPYGVDLRYMSASGWIRECRPCQRLVSNANSADVPAFVRAQLLSLKPLLRRSLKERRPPPASAGAHLSFILKVQIRDGGLGKGRCVLTGSLSHWLRTSTRQSSGAET